MIAASTARIDSAGKVYQLDGKAAPDEMVTEKDVQEPAKLARFVWRLLADVASLKRRFAPSALSFEDVAVGAAGTLTQLGHGFSGRVRWYVSSWRTTATPTTDNLLCLATTWMMRGLWGPGTLTTTAGNFTTGVRFQATSPCSVTGCRFLWKAATRTVKATLWRDSDGVVLGTGTASCVNSGVYAVLFASPVVLAAADLNVNLTLGIHDQAGTAYTATAGDTPFTGLLPMTLPGFTLSAINLFLAGDARPTSSAATEVYWVEPLLTPAFPQLIESTATDASTLAITSYAPGTASIHVEAAG